MGNAQYIGRVGALAVALGIGAWMAIAPWAASAKPADSGTSSSTSSTTSSTSATSSAPAGKPDDGTGPCSSACGVGSEGQGGNAGNAQGGYVIRPARVPDTTVRFAGPADSGLLELSGAVEGGIFGHIHNRETGEFTGRLTGVESPNEDGSPCTGHCVVP
jgi:hypothetical protein